MAIERFTAQKELAFDYVPRVREFIASVPLGGSIKIESWDGAAWVTTDTVTSSTSHNIRTAGVRLRFTPTGGASFSIDTTRGNV